MNFIGNNDPKTLYETEKKKKMPFEIFPSEYKITTITTNSYLYYEDQNNIHHPILINYISFFKKCPLHKNFVQFKKYRFHAKRWDWNDVIEYIPPAQKRTKKNSKMKGVFYNQATLEILSDYSNKEITTFLYGNGNLNNTGNKHIEDTYCIQNKLVAILSEIQLNDPFIYYYEKIKFSDWDDKHDELECYLKQNATPVDLTRGRIVCVNTKVSTKNAKYNVGMCISRENLADLIRENKIKDSSFPMYLGFHEKGNYAGANIKINWRDKNCFLEKHVSSKKKRTCSCREITVLSFESGEVMISGAQTDEQLEYVKSTFDKLIRENIEKVFDFDINSSIDSSISKREKRVNKYLVQKTVVRGENTFLVIDNNDNNNEHP